MKWLSIFFVLFGHLAYPIEYKAFKFIDANALMKASHIHLSEIPIQLRDKVLPFWMMDTIRNEVSHFPQFTTKELEDFFSSTGGLFHFRIRNGKLSVRCNQDGLFPPMTEYTAAILNILEQPCVSILNADFLLEFADTVAKRKVPVPILCFCKDPESNCILVPDSWAIWKDRIALMREIDLASNRFPWEIKLNKAFWMGATNGLYFEDPFLWRTNQRSRVVLFGLDHPDLVFAKFAPFLNEDRICDEMKRMHKILSAPRRSQPDSCKFKYQLDVEGWGCGFHRTQWTLRSNCVCVKQKGPNTQWHYSGLKPYVHYVPYESDCSDLFNVLQWLEANDDQAKQIALQGRLYAIDYLNTDITYLYLYHTLLELSKLQKL